MSLATSCLKRRSYLIQCLISHPRCLYGSRITNTSRRYLQTAAPQTQAAVPLRKQLKDEAKRKKLQAKLNANKQSDKTTSTRHTGWELTVGIEIHARLNTEAKLFSHALSSTSEEPNQHVEIFDAALPGAQPRFQVAALIPAIRAALALGCNIQRRSAWDRKHYFYQDQPNGYQITQYYEPFARDGKLTLTPFDGPDATELVDGKVEIGIKQVQMEQDTAKTTQQGTSSTYLIDYSRVGAPLIEIITLPHIHSPGTAAAVVRKIRDLLRSVDACSGNMENGDLRADVNVSVKRVDAVGSESYYGVKGLGTRTEIKNLNSFKSVEDAVAAERDRQIAVLEAGGVVEGETRGWVVGGTETTRLRSKEGEVDYRYMPDPDLSPVYIDDKLVEDLRASMPIAPEAVIERIMVDFDISAKDATTLLTLDDGDRLEYAAETMSLITSGGAEAASGQAPLDQKKIGKTAANWTLHEIGGLLAIANKAWDELLVTPQDLSAIISHLLQRHITGRSAKQLLQTVFDGEAVGKSVEQLIDEGNLRLRPMSEDEYTVFAQTILDENPEAVAAVKEKGQKGKVMFFVGQMMRRADEGTVEADKAKQVIERLLEI
ncbi:mitochondrial cytochrome c oxidase assembly factor [Myriangium duriaei CBS 260.36]|uniref:Glutamyl-tRNA(Gln) amidotransferase subunit B, mitochondrial n=1 Tax=Myriangium duriaei CBS 260.36 TaxID=1168546 RepID=A0A9P4J3F9_9PEZI|nr:mitochondrial cytochrome c oxidase assembly factor [Myriangium duriaei CBS 260.36]